MKLVEYFLGKIHIQYHLFVVFGLNRSEKLNNEMEPTETNLLYSVYVTYTSDTHETQYKFDIIVDGLFCSVLFVVRLGFTSRCDKKRENVFRGS